MKDIISSRKTRLVAGGIGALFLALLVFHAGVVVGSHRNSFGRFDMDRGFRPSFFPNGFRMPHEFISNAHGAVGTITALTLPTFTMETREGTTKTILVSTSTLIRSLDTEGATTLSIGNKVIVLGEPESQNRISAKLIHILPAAPALP